MGDRGGDSGSERRHQTWRGASGAKERRRHRRPDDQRSTLRRVTVFAAIAATGLNAVLFAQVGVHQSGAGALQDSIIAAVNGLFPRGGLQPPREAPNAAPGTTPVATTGGS